MIAAILSNAIEFLAFFVGFIYYRKYKSMPSFYLVGFLGITFLFELLSWYSYFIYSSLVFLQGTLFESNYWLGNIYAILSYLFYTNYFKWYLSNKKSIVVLNRFSAVFFALSILELVFSEGFFTGFMPITTIFGTLLVFLSIAFYYLELLRSDQILQVHKSLPFYVSVGALIFHLCTTPMFLYSSYYSNSVDPEFVNLYRVVIFGANYFLYSIYIVGFIICSQKRHLYFPKKSF